MPSFLERPVGMATLAAGFLRFLGFLFPVVATPLFTYHIGQFDFTFTAAQPLATLVVVAVFANHYLIVLIGRVIPIVLASLEIVAIALIVIAGDLFCKQH